MFLAIDAKALNETRRLEDEKANRQQEGWIAPTMLNGWASQISSTFPIVQFLKDEFGFVHLKGHSHNGSDDLLFIIPEGYRPAISESYVIPNGYRGTVTTTNLEIRTSGEVYAVNGFRPALNGIVFKAVD